MTNLLISVLTALAMLQSGAPADVRPGHWAFRAVDDLYRTGILRGYPAGFKGTAPASNYEVAAVLSGVQESIRGNGPRDQGRNDDAKLSQQLEETKVQMKALRQEVDSLRSLFETIRAEIAGLRAKLKG